MFACPYPGCKASYLTLKGQRKHESLKHVTKDTKCLGCGMNFSTTYKRNEHHYKCNEYMLYVQRLHQQYQPVQSVQPVQPSSMIYSISPTGPIDDATMKIVDYTVKMGGTVNINYNSNNNTTTHNHMDNNSRNTQNNILNYNLKPIDIDAMVERITTIVQEAESKQQPVSTEIVGHKLALDFKDSFVCTDKSRLTTKYIDGDQLVVDNQCAKLDQQLYSKMKPVCATEENASMRFMSV